MSKQPVPKNQPKWQDPSGGEAGRGWQHREWFCALALLGSHVGLVQVSVCEIFEEEHGDHETGPQRSLQ